MLSISCHYQTGKCVLWVGANVLPHGSQESEGTQGVFEQNDAPAVVCQTPVQNSVLQWAEAGHSHSTEVRNNRKFLLTQSAKKLTSLFDIFCPLPPHSLLCPHNAVPHPIPMLYTKTRRGESSMLQAYLLKIIWSSHNSCLLDGQGRPDVHLFPDITGKHTVTYWIWGCMTPICWKSKPSQDSSTTR